MGRRDRGAARRYELYTKGGTFGPEQKGWLLFADGEKLVGEGKAIRIVENDELLCYQLTSSETKSEKVKPDPLVSDAMLTRSEISAVVSEHCKGGENIHGIDGGPAGRSRTAGMSERKRKLREAMGLETHDFVERSRYKLNQFDPRRGRTVVRRGSPEA